MSTHNIGFYEDLTKIIFELSSNMHLISSADGIFFPVPKPLASFCYCSCAAWCVTDLVINPKDRFSYNPALI